MSLIVFCTANPCPWACRLIYDRGHTVNEKPKTITVFSPSDVWLLFQRLNAGLKECSEPWDFQWNLDKLFFNTKESRWFSSTIIHNCLLFQLHFVTIFIPPHFILQCFWGFFFFFCSAAEQLSAWLLFCIIKFLCMMRLKLPVVILRTLCILIFGFSNGKLLMLVCRVRVLLYVKIPMQSTYHLWERLMFV